MPQVHKTELTYPAVNLLPTEDALAWGRSMFISQSYRKNPFFTSYKRGLLDDFLNFLQYEGFFAFVSVEASKET